MMSRIAASYDQVDLSDAGTMTRAVTANTTTSLPQAIKNPRPSTQVFATEPDH